MKTKLDELLSNYLRKDKKALTAFSAKAELSETFYEVSMVHEQVPIKKRGMLFSQIIRLWNLSTAKEKPAFSKKEEVVFPEFLEFALKSADKPKNKKDGSRNDNATANKTAASQKKSAKNRSDASQEEALSTENISISLLMIKPEHTAQKPLEANSTHSSRENKQTPPEPVIEETSQINKNQKSGQEWVWVTKGKAERKKAILEVLTRYDNISILDLCRLHASEIGIIWPDINKWVEKPWKAIRGDCQELSKEKKLHIFKNERRMVQVSLLNRNEPLPSAVIKTVAEEHVPETGKELSLPQADLSELKKSLLHIEEQLNQLTNEIITIWKTVAMISLD